MRHSAVLAIVSLVLFAAATGAQPEPLAAAAALLSAQRNLRILGIFARLAKRDGKPRYLALIPRVWGHLQTALANPALADLRSALAPLLPEPTPDVLAGLSRP